jgi:phage gp36-like protein
LTTPITEYAGAADLIPYALNRNAFDAIDLPTKVQAINGASRVIDSYLRARFQLPLVQVGEDVKRACAILAVYDLISARGFNPEGTASEANFRLRYQDTIKWLERIADGRAEPDVTDSSSGAHEGYSPAGPAVSTSTQRGWSSRGNSTVVPFTGD